MSPRAGIDISTILQAAEVILDSSGWDSLSLAALAQALQIRPPSLYNHITGLSELRAKLASRGCALLIQDMTRAAVGKYGDDAVRAMGETYLAFARTHPGLYEAIQRAPNSEDEEWQRFGRALVDLVVQVFQFYGLDDESAIHAVRGFRSLVHGFTSLERIGGFGMPLDVDTSYQWLMDSFLAGIHAMNPTSK